MKVDFEDRKYWKTQKCNNLIKLVDLLAKSTSDVLCNFVFIFRWNDGVISMNFYPIWPVINAWSIWVEIHWDLVVIISMDLHPIWPVKFNQALITGHIGWKFIEITLYPCLVKLGISVNSTGIYLNGFTSNLTSQIQLVKFDRALITRHIGWIWRVEFGCKFIEIDAGQFGCKLIEITLYACLVKLGISVNSTSIYLNGFTPNLTSQIRPVEFGCKSIEIDAGQIG